MKTTEVRFLPWLLSTKDRGADHGSRPTDVSGWEDAGSPRPLCERRTAELMADQPSEYARGRTQGENEQRFAGYDKHFETINGSIADSAESVHTLRTELVDAVHKLTLEMQRIADQAVARDETARITAEALEKARVLLKESAEQKWSPWQKAFAVILALGAVVAIIVAIQGLT